MILDKFKEACVLFKSDSIVQQYLIENSTYFFKKIEIGKEYAFKKEISAILDVHIRDIVIVGSGKLGFSLKPDNSDLGLYLFKEFDYNYKNNLSKKKSDLDIAIISSSLFDKEMKNLYDHTSFYKNNWSEKNSLAKYILKGRLAIRYLPVDFKFTKEIISVQEKYMMEYGREINLEIYKSWHYFETYHQENIKTIQVNLIR